MYSWLNLFRISTMGPRRLAVWRLVLILACYAGLGALMPFTFAPYEYVWLQFVLLMLLITAARASGTWACAFGVGLCFGLGQYLHGLHSTFGLLYIFGEGRPMIPKMISALLLYGGYCLFLSLFHAVFAVVVNRLPPPQDHSIGWRWILGVACAWAVLEWLRGCVGIEGLSIYSLGYAHSGWALKSWASWGGLLLVGFWVAWMAAAAQQGLSLCCKDVRGFPRLAPPIIMAVLLPVLAGAALANIEWTHPTGRTLRLTLLQGNQSQPEREAATAEEQSRNIYLEMFDRIEATDLLIFPENPLPKITYPVPLASEPVWQRLRSVMQQHHAHALLSLVARTPNQGHTNSVLHLNGNWPIELWPHAPRYDKSHLMPVGEYTPPWLRFIHMLGVHIPMSDFSTEYKRLEPFVVKGVPVAVSICYEIMFGDELRNQAMQAGMLINLSNNVWFAHTSIPDQLQQMVRMRALESGRAVVSVDNVSTTAVTNFDGREIQRLTPYARGQLTLGVPERQGMTPYLAMGDLPWALVWGVLLLACWHERRISEAVRKKWVPAFCKTEAQRQE